METTVSILKSLFAATMGFILGMALAGVGGLSAETLFSSFLTSENTKKIENYWQDTGLGLADVEALISDSKCADSKIYHTACLNAFIQNTSKYEMQLSALSGTLNESTKAGSNDELTEAELLKKYDGMRVRVDFTKNLRTLFSRAGVDNQAQLASQMINSFLSVYVDPHTYILPASFYQEVSSKLERSKYFVGLSYEKKGGEFFIQKISKNSDADISGLKPQDKIMAINSTVMQNISYAEVSKILRDEDTKAFIFDIERNGSRLRIPVTRSYRLLSHVQYNNVGTNNNIGLLTLSKFSRGVCAEAAKILKKSQGLEGLILDLRDNPGGQLDEASCLAGLFLGKDKKAYYVEYLDDDKPNEVVLTSEELVYKGPLVVLVNSRSASASESLSGALQDYKRALVVGRRTFGKGTFQEPESWVLNPKVSLFKTQGRYLLPSRNATQVVGVKPDIEMAAEQNEKREENIFFRPLEKAAKKYPSLKPTELVYSSDFEFSFKNCKRSLSAQDDIYLQAGVQMIDCAVARKNSLAQTLPLNFNLF